MSLHLCNQELQKKPKNKSQQTFFLNQVNECTQKIYIDIQKCILLKYWKQPPETLVPSSFDVKLYTRLHITPFKILGASQNIHMDIVEKLPAEPCHIHTDERLFNTIFNALMTFAIEHTPPGKLIRVGLMKSHTEFVLEILFENESMNPITDVIDPEILEDMSPLEIRFPEKFLPLVIGIYLLKKLNLHCSMHSQKGKGSVFFLHLPAEI